MVPIMYFARIVFYDDKEHKLMYKNFSCHLEIPQVQFVHLKKLDQLFLRRIPILIHCSQKYFMN